MSGLSSSDVLEVLDADATVEKRASWEAFEFTIRGSGDVEVRNASHEKPAEHTYTVHVEGDIPSDCSCPAWEYREGSCKHMVAVAIRGPVLEAVNAEARMRADGGVAVEREESDDSDERPEDCDCGEWNEGLGLSCWPCFREGFEEPASVEESE